MITIYDRYETAFTYNGFGILEVYDDVVEEELNGIFKFTFKYPYTARLADKVTVGSMLRVDTPEGAEPFRIWTVKNTDGTLEVTAYHVTFDLYYQIIEDKYLVNLGGQAALTRLLEDTPFTALSDVTTSASARVVRKTVQQAIFSDDDNSFLNRWGGEFVRDGFTLNAKNFRGRTFAQNPVAIRYGKNLVSYESEIDESTYHNRIMPVGFDGLLLPEKYVDRPGIDLNDIRVKIVEYSDIKAIADIENPQEDELPLAEAEQAMRDKALAEFADGLYDPKVNHRVSFVDLSSTVEYENIAVLEKRYLGDEVKVINQDGIDVIARVVSYQYSPTTKKYIQIELGNFQEKPMSIVSRIDVVSRTIDEVSKRQITIDHVTDLLTSALGGYVKQINGEMFIMDTEDPNTATKVWRWNLNGLGYSSTGVNGPYETAITMDGTIVGTFIQANTISTAQISNDASIRLVANSLVTIDEDGLTVGIDGSTIVSRQSYDGFRVLDGDDITASMVGGIVSIPELYSDRIHGDVINTHPGGTISIGTGRDFTTINEALQAIGNRKHLLGDLTFNVYNTIIEDITIRGFSGGMIYIRLVGGAIHGDVNFYQNSAGGYLLGVGERGLVKGSIRFTGGNGYIQSLIVDPEDLTSTGIVSEYGSQVFIMNCDIVNAKYAVLAQFGGTIMALNNIGEIGGGQAVYNTYNGGVLYARGTMPLGTPKFGGTTTAFQHDFTTTQEPSEYDPPTAIPTLMSQTFSPTKLETYSYQYNAISSYYPGRAAQNRWDTGTSMFEGRITFAGAVRNYINDRNGDTGLKVELQVKRYSGTNGSWSGVAPDNQFSITGGSFGSVEKGAWSGWVTLSPTLIPTSGYTFKFGSQSTGDKYAVWDGARIRVTKTKNI